MSASVGISGWDYAWDEAGTPWIVVTDEDGAGRLDCANVPGAQLQHLSCPVGGPCSVADPYPPPEFTE
jgi:hypothetical protein